MNKIALAFVVVIGFGRVAFADDQPTPTETKVYEALVPADDVQAVQRVQQEAQQAAEQIRQTEINKAIQGGYVLRMDGQIYGRPDVIAREEQRQATAYINPDGSEGNYLDNNNNFISREQYLQNFQESNQKTIERAQKQLRQDIATTNDPAIKAEAERGFKEFEKNLQAMLDGETAKANALTPKNDKPFAVPSSWSAEKINLYNKAKNLGITLFEDDGGQTTKSDDTTVESEKEESKPTPPAPKVLVSPEKGSA